MMRSRRPWWAVLTATTLVLASLLAPMEGAAYRIVGLEPGGVQKGDPDNPSSGKAPSDNVTTSPKSVPLIVTVSMFQGQLLILQIPVPPVVMRRLARVTK